VEGLLPVGYQQVDKWVGPAIFPRATFFPGGNFTPEIIYCVYHGKASCLPGPLQEAGQVVVQMGTSAVPPKPPHPLEKTHPSGRRDPSPMRPRSR